MENFSNLLKELNETENKYVHVHKQYVELQSLVRTELPNIIKQENIEKSIQNTKISLETIPVDKSNQSNPNKKAVKNRIKHYHTVISNMEKFKSDDGEKLKFTENLQKANEAVLEKHLENPIVIQFFNAQKHN